MGRRGVDEPVNVFNVYEKGIQIFEGNAEQVSNLLKVSKGEIYDAKNGDVLIRGKYTVWLKSEEEITKEAIHDHLWTADGRRKYEYKKGMPNRYKDASSVRFTPL